MAIVVAAASALWNACMQAAYTSFGSAPFDDCASCCADDDLVYVHPGAFRAMLRLKLTSDFLIVSGNVVNHPMLSHAHQCVAAALPGR